MIEKRKAEITSRELKLKCSRLILNNQGRYNPDPRKKKNHIRDTREQFNHCSDVIGRAAEMASGIILENKPELVGQADCAYLSQEDSKVKTRLKQAAGVFNR